MKKIKDIFKILVVIAFVTSVYSLEAQPPPPPGGGSNTQVTKLNGNGGGAPIGSGLFILLGLSAAYGGRKLYKISGEDSVSSN